MQADTSTLGNVTVNDARNQPKPKAVEKPKEKTAEEREKFKAAQDKIHARMFAHSKKEEPKKDEKAKTEEKTDDKKTENGAETKTKEKTATATESKAKPETKSETASDKKADKTESTDGGDGKQVETAKAEEKNSEAKTDTKAVAKKEATQPPVDVKELAKEVATATAKAIKDSEKKETKPEDEVPESRRREVAAIEYLEKNNPRYKGKLEAYKKFAKAEADYVAKWECENPGQKFDPDSEDHSNWYDRHEPDIDPEDVNEARIELAAERRASALVEQKSKSTEEKLAALQLERDVERAERDVPVFVNRNLAIVGAAMGEEVVAKLKELKPGGTLEESDPAAHATMMTVWPELHRQTVAATRIFGTEGKGYDPNNADHAAVAESARELEELIASQPAEKLKDERGRTFVKLDDWAGMNSEQKAKHWTLNADLMTSFLAEKASAKAQASYKTEREKAEKLAKAYGYVKNGESHEARNGDTNKEEDTTTGSEKTRSPSTSARTVIQPGAKVDPKTGQDGADRMLNRMFRR